MRCGQFSIDPKSLRFNSEIIFYYNYYETFQLIYSAKRVTLTIYFKGFLVKKRYKDHQSKKRTTF